MIKKVKQALELLSPYLEGEKKFGVEVRECKDHASIQYLVKLIETGSIKKFTVLKDKSVEIGFPSAPLKTGRRMIVGSKILTTKWSVIQSKD